MTGELRGNCVSLYPILPGQVASSLRRAGLRFCRNAWFSLSAVDYNDMVYSRGPAHPSSLASALLFLATLALHTVNYVVLMYCAEQ